MKACFIDDKPELDCILDGNGYMIDDCPHARELYRHDKTKEDCEYWKEVYVHSVICPKCGHEF